MTTRTEASPSRETESTAPTDDEKAIIRWPVLIGSAIIITVIALWALISPEDAADKLGVAVGWTSEWLGWFYIALATFVLVFVLYLGLRFSKVRLGKDTDRPEFSTFAWASMLFAAGIGTDVMFFAVAEPASQYLFPPQGGGETIEAAREATVWTLFHYGITGWGMYALMGIALGYFSHRKELPLAVRSALYPLFGKRINGKIGHTVDVATVLGTIFGVATSLGIGVVMLNVGLDIMFGIEQGLPARIGLVVLAVFVATISATTGVDRGIRILSQLNVLLAIVLAAWVLVTGNTTFLLRAMMMNVGDFVSMFPGLTLDTMAYDYPADWMGAWTLFFWAWWVAWASFVGMFLARISKGRTLGQFVVGTMTIPFSYIVMWATIFGNSAVERIRDGDAAFGELATESPELGFFTLLQDVPGATFVIGLSTFVGLLFYVTSADSGALVMANLSSKLPNSDVDARPWLRIFWAIGCGILTISMLIVDGIPALQNATIVMGVPFSIVMILVMVGLHRALENERRLEDAARTSLTSQVVGLSPTNEPGSWRRRLGRQLTGISAKRATMRLNETVVPALNAVASELNERGMDAKVIMHEVPDRPRPVMCAELIVASEGFDDFTYPVRVHRVRKPAYGGRMIEADETTTRLDVVLPNDVAYDIYDYTSEQVCHDVLDHYERWAGTAHRIDIE